MDASHPLYIAAREALLAASPELGNDLDAIHLAALRAASAMEANGAEPPAAVDPQSERAAERARIAGCIAAGHDLGRARQIARLALAGPLTPTGAKALVSTLPLDSAAPAEALRISSIAAQFGGPSAQSERSRIASILGSASAADRFSAAASFATSTDFDVEQVKAALALLPVESTKRIPTIAERAAEMAEFGGSETAFSGRVDGKMDVDAMWKKAVHEANVSIGAVDPTPRPAAAPGAPSPVGAEHLNHPHARGGIR
ncbi:hypothetical protein D1122_14875 [Cereibacter sphaeroides]|uniref:hypothetical protein n=1 Tax=Cereibacter sphaeroides TaxID=1063 RepID=UPI000E5BCD01|nr:hypothetical protein [Cereibacter sphaeroides]RHZ95334.1 hypothetical protein D1122_14875 [Cereibacter sphaeroides]